MKAVIITISLTLIGCASSPKMICRKMETTVLVGENIYQKIQTEICIDETVLAEMRR